MPRIFDFRWSDDAQKFFEMIEKKEISRHLITQGEDFSFEVIDDIPHCVGSRKKGVYEECATNESGMKKCEACRKKDDYFPCQFCNGFNCSRFRDEKIENCDSDHMVYLAFFTPELIKVGVSRSSRGKARQFEQGTHTTRIFATGLSGVIARRIETNLQKAGFPDKIPATQKKDLLLPDISQEEVNTLLDEKFTFAKQVITAQMPEILKSVTGEVVLWEMTKMYSDIFEELQNSSKPLCFLKLQKGESIGGKLVMIRGPFLIIETDTELFSLLVKDYIGKEVSFTGKHQGLTTQEAFQSALF